MRMLHLACIFVAMYLIGPTSFATDITVAPGGMTVHGDSIDPELASHMPHRLTKSGSVVYHTEEIGVKVKSGYYQYYGTYLRDCFDQHAGMLGLGMVYTLSNFEIGYVHGLYARHIYRFTDDHGGHWSDKPMPFSFINDDMEYAPVFMGTLAYRFEIAGHPVEWFLGSDYYLTHTQLGFLLDL